MPKTIIIVLMYDFFVFACLEYGKMYMQVQIQVPLAQAQCVYRFFISARLYNGCTC